MSRRHREQCEGEQTPSLGLACLGVQYLGVPIFWGLINEKKTKRNETKRNLRDTKNSCYWVEDPDPRVFL